MRIETVTMESKVNEDIEIIKDISNKLIALQVEYGLLGSCAMIHLLLHNYLKTNHGVSTKIINGFCHFEDEHNNNVTAHVWLKYEDKIINITLNHNNSNKLCLLGEELYAPTLKNFVLIETEEDMKKYMLTYHFTELHSKISRITASEKNIKEYLVNSPDQLCEKIVAHLEYGKIKPLNKEELYHKIQQLYNVE